ncbi:hypothetical protein LPJ75_007057 [Coemansia sp. RSA 2598]|nr:hypothetical protein LPJ75_007057 [Coemansia sp. RSA 2598]
MGMFSSAQSISNIPAASSSTAGLVTPGISNIFSNQAIAGSTPNLGTFNRPLTSIGNGSMSGYTSNIAATHSVTNFGSLNMPQSQQQSLQSTAALTMGNQLNQTSQVGSKYDLFKAINPNAPSVFNGGVNIQQSQPQQMQQVPGLHNTLSGSSLLTTNSYNLASQQGNMSRPTGPTGIFAMANPTLGQNPMQQQQQANMFQNPMAMNPQLQQQQQTQQQQQQFFNVNQAAGFGNQMKWH